MNGFIDEYPHRKLKTFDFRATPRFNTNITAASAGTERRTANWDYPLHRYTAPGAVDCIDTMLQVKDMWMALFGPLYSFPFRDPVDHASRPVQVANTAPSISAGDQVLETPEAGQTQFQLRKAYTYGSATMWRPIFKPVVESVLAARNGTPYDPSEYTVDRESGIITFDSAPGAGAVVTAGFLFDVEVRFEDDDSYDQIVNAFGVTGNADLTFVEIPPC